MTDRDIVSDLRAESETDCVAYTEFMLAFKKNSNKIYAFYEGYEDRYYYPIRIEGIITQKELVDFICIGKENVLKIHSLVKASSAYKDCETLFFVDSDFDDNDAFPDSIFVTPTYSLENLYTTPKAIEKILVSEFKFIRDSDDLKKCVEMYNSLINSYITDITILNIWLACQARLRKEQNISTRLKIDNALKGIIDKKMICERLENYNRIDEVSTIEKIKLLFQDAPNVDLPLFSSKELEFNTKNKLLSFRGKFLLKFLEAFLCRLQSIDYKKNSDIFNGKYSSSLRIEYNTLCTNLTQYAETPSSLRDYLMKFN